MSKDYTQRRNERWESLFPGLGLESILGRILRIARYHNHKSTEAMRPFGIKNGEADVLSALLHAGPPHILTPKDITRQAYRTPGAITNVLDHLEEKGLLRRTLDVNNRRSILVELTPEGLRVARDSFLAQTAMEKGLLTMLTPEEKEQLRGLLKRILLELEEKGEI
jgi:transcriptional regulator